MTLKNTHLRRQHSGFEAQRTTQYASPQILSASLHLGIFERQPGKLRCLYYELQSTFFREE